MEEALDRAEGRVARLTRAQAAAAGLQPGRGLATPQREGRVRRPALPQIQSPANSNHSWRPRRPARGRPRCIRPPAPAPDRQDQQRDDPEDDEWGGIRDEDEPENDQAQGNEPDGQDEIVPCKFQLQNYGRWPIPKPGLKTMKARSACELQSRLTIRGGLGPSLMEGPMPRSEEKGSEKNLTYLMSPYRIHSRS